MIYPTVFTQENWVSGNNYTAGIYADKYIVFAFLFVHSSVLMFVLVSVTFVEFTTQLRESFSSGEYLTHYSSEIIHIWTMGTLEGLLPCLGFWPRGSCPRVGLDVKI